MSFEEKKDLVKDVRRKRAWLRLKDLVTWPQTVKDHPAHVLKNWEGNSYGIGDTDLNILCLKKE